MKLKVT